MAATRKSWNLLHFDDIARASVPEQWLRFSMASLDSAERLCKILSRSTRKANYERGSIVMYLTVHAVELFLKGAISLKAPSEKFGHDLERLYQRYLKLYPAKKYRFELPFGVVQGDMTKAEMATARALSPQVDQLYRYPLDKNGVPWNGLFAFEPNMFLQTLAILRRHIEWFDEERRAGRVK